LGSTPNWEKEILAAKEHKEVVFLFALFAFFCGQSFPTRFGKKTRAVPRDSTTSIRVPGARQILGEDADSARAD
jgi:hypothetical protein